MIKSHQQQINICTRAIIIEDDQLVICQWEDREGNVGSPYMIGGRVEHGEPLTEALVREIREETGATAKIEKLIYMHENIFVDLFGTEIHELGYYFLVTCDREICPDNQPSQNGDHLNLFNKRIPLTEAGLAGLTPAFIRNFLPFDRVNDFHSTPRMIYSSDIRSQVEEQTHLFLSRESAPALS